MTTNNLKIAIRVLWRDKVNTIINLFGLTLGIGCFLLLGLYVQQELSYDQFHSRKDRIYRSWLREDYGEGQVFFNSIVPLRFETLFEDNFPEVETAVQWYQTNYLVGRGENRINENVSVISPEFFEVFDFSVLEGQTSEPLKGKRDIIVSQTYARKYFGTDDPIGQTLPLQLDSAIHDFVVTAVFQDFPETSSIQFDLAFSNVNNRDIFGEGAMNAWFSVGPETYLLLKENAEISAIESKIQDVVMGYLEGRVEEDVYNIGFQPLTDIHLNPDIPLGNAPVSNPQYVAILGVIAILVLIIACINYATLSIGQSLKRAKEVGMRKVLGAGKSSLVYQYLSESLIITMVSMIIGLALTLVLIPTFNRLTGTEIYYQFEWFHSVIYLGIGLVVALVAGGYPAFILSSFKTLSILRGVGFTGGKNSVRKGMLVFQFLITLFLIASTLIIREQVVYLQNKDLGYTYEAKVALPLYADPTAGRLSEVINSTFANGELLKAKLSQHPEISDIAMGSHVLGTNGWANLGYTDDQDVFRRFRFLVVDAFYLSSFRINLLEGRDFDPQSGLDKRQSVILNQAAANYFNLGVGDKLPGNEFGDHRIIGITEDFHFSSLHDEVEPLVIVQSIDAIIPGVSDGDFEDTVVPKMVLTYTGNNLSNVNKLLSESWESTFPNESLSWHFISERLKSQYENEARMNSMITVATILSIVIAVLGLLGLTILVVNSKLKEIGIRKVMGADSIKIFWLLARSFSWQMLLAVILSIPLTIMLMNSWLENFAYHIQISPVSFVISAFLSMAIAGAVILYHTYRAMRINPVESLRDE